MKVCRKKQEITVGRGDGSTEVRERRRQRVCVRFECVATEKIARASILIPVYSI